MSQSAKADRKSRDKWLHVKVTEQEREHLKMLAHARDLTVADLVREAVQQRTEGVKPRRQRLTLAADPALLAALGRIGNNLNQVGRWVNRYKSGADAVEVLAALVAIEREIKALLPEQAGEGGEDAGAVIQ